MIFAGVDIGGTYIKAGLFRAGGETIAKDQVATGAGDGPRVVMKRVKNLIHTLLTSQDMDFSYLQHVGVGIPGTVDVDTGRVGLAPNLFWCDLPVKDQLESLLNLPVIIDNDAHMAALGERWQGAGRGFNSLLMVTMGTGVGSALIIEGKIHRGYFGYGAELGHVKIECAGTRCHCGGIGCLENVASAAAIGKIARAYLAKGEQSLLQNKEEVDARIVIQAAGQGDCLAKKVIQEVTGYLGTAIANAVLLAGPEVVIIGGGVAQAGGIILDPIRDRINICLGSWQVKKLPVVAAQLGNDAGIIGAAYLAINISK